MEYDLRPLFVLGAPRSGTTFLTQLLNCLDDVFITDELRIVSWLSVESKKIEEGYKTFGNPYPFNFGPEFSRYLIESFAGFVKPFFKDLANSRYGKADLKWWGDKYPHYDEQIELISKVFPRARYVYIYRDPGDVVMSVMKGHKWSFDKSCDYVSEILQSYFSKISRNLDKDAVYFIKYEDLVLETDQIFKDMASFLNSAVSESVLNKVADLRGIQSHSIRSDKSNPVAFDASKAFGRWRDSLSEEDIVKLAGLRENLKQAFPEYNRIFDFSGS